MRIKKEVIKRQIAGETILVPVGKSVYDANGLFVLNELGAFIWDLLPQAQTEEDILTAILAAYEIDEITARADLEEFLQQLQKLDII